MNKRKKIEQITLAGLVANILLSVVKLVIGFFGNSQAVIADALHSFSDTSSDLIILFGVKYWTAPPDEDHPFGHQKIESLVTIVIGLILIFAAFAIGYDGVLSLMESEPVRLSPVVLLGPILSIIVKEILFKVTFKVGVETHSSSLKANAWHHRTDALSSVPVLVAVTASLIDPRLSFLDAVGAILVSVFIINVGISILFSNISDLLDTGISKEQTASIEAVIKAQDHVMGVHKLRTRKMASYIYIDLHLEVDGQLTVKEGHQISEDVKTVLMTTYPKIIDVMVHLEPRRNSAGPE